MKVLYRTKWTISGTYEYGGKVRSWQETIETVVPAHERNIKGLIDFHIQDLVRDYMRGENLTSTREVFFI